MNVSLSLLRKLLSGLASLPVLASAAGLQPLDDQAMATVTGQAGIALDLELRVNADSNGAALASMDNCSGVGNGCILALQFANRNAGGGEWLVLKDIFGVLRFRDLQLDGARLPAVASAFPATDSRFQKASGGTFDPNGSLAASLGFLDVPGFNADIEWKLNVGRGAVQFGADAFLPSADNGASFVGLRIDDSQTNTARVDIGGRIQLFGF